MEIEVRFESEAQQAIYIYVYLSHTQLQCVDSSDGVHKHGCHIHIGMLFINLICCQYFDK